tara:strand:+ start:71 stop:877 length:807 start_codon:yes stop_codon:yes gene_type:complete
VAPVLAALRAGRREVHRLYLQEGLSGDRAGKGPGRKDAGAVRAAVALAEEKGAEVLSSGKHELNLLSRDRPHQGLVLDAQPLGFTSLPQMPPASVRDSGGRPPLWLALDEVLDPQNFGAILRSAHFLGASGVVTCGKNSAPMSPVVSKASAGAMEVMEVYSCRSFPTFLKEAAEGGWDVFGASVADGAVGSREVEVTQASLLVVGNEGFGLRPLVERACTRLVRVDPFEGAGPAGQGSSAVDSLNVSVATGILLHELLVSRERGSHRP